MLAQVEALSFTKLRLPPGWPAQVRTVPVQVRTIALDQLKVKPAKVEEVNSVESSLRLDALASAGEALLEPSESNDDVGGKLHSVMLQAFESVGAR